MSHVAGDKVNRHGFVVLDWGDERPGRANPARLRLSSGPEGRVYPDQPGWKSVISLAVLLKPGALGRGADAVNRTLWDIRFGLQIWLLDRQELLKSPQGFSGASSIQDSP